jgi:EAL domain-containing protein (putative c-di-GMP-specific phosphodiesterase class I)
VSDEPAQKAPQAEPARPEDFDRTTPGLVSPALAQPASRAGGPWLLESRLEGAGELRRMLIQPLPFRVGRQPGLELVLPSQLVSKVHAEIYESAGKLFVRDLHSMNGTFVNRQLIADAPIHEGDILHFADFEFMLGCLEPAGPHDTRDPATISLGKRSLPRGFVKGTRELKELLEQEAATVVLQPIVRLPTGAVVAYEMLGRGCHPDLPAGPDALFEIAAAIGAEAQLSRLFRRKAVALAIAHPNLPSLFLNTHPTELELPGLLESLEELRAGAPSIDVILEIHESALAQPGFISWFRSRLAEINVGLAYDDFGAGQARLLELAEAPPNFLKFDRRFVAGIDRAPASRRRLLASLVAAARELLVKTVAEGVETAGEVEVCRRVGFTHAQGFYFGAGRPVDEL